MKTVGKQLQEARLAKNWTPELAARETKIKVDRLRDLEADDYTHFSSPTYARGFVRTYARALGLDEYKILRQLDNKLPEDDNASFASDSGVSYIPEPSRTIERSRSRGTGLYVVLTLGFVVVFIIAFVLFQAYRAGELQTILAESSTPETTSAPATNAPSAPVTTATDTPARALPADPNAPVPSPVDTNQTAQAMPPADTNTVVSTGTNGAPVATDASGQSVRAQPVNPADLTNAAPQVAAVTNTVSDTADSTNKAPLRAQPVDPSELTGMAPATNAAPAPTPSPVASSSSKGPRLPAPIATVAQLTSPTKMVAPATNDTAQPAASVPTTKAGGPLVLTASRDSFVRVTAIDAPDMERVLYARVLSSGQSVSFDGHKFSVNVGIPSAVDITLDGVNYGPHSDQEAPETFTVESHQP